VKRMNNLTALLLITTGTFGCASARSILALDTENADRRPISNPFGEYYANGGAESSSPIILRTKKGDRSVEVELPGTEGSMTDFVIPVSPAFRDSSRSPASSMEGTISEDESYRDRSPSLSDREITANMPQNASEDDGARREIETGLGLVPTQEPTPQHDKSYLAAVDHIKQLYRLGRHEAALIEIDDMIRTFQTDPKLHEMRGTLLDRLGKTDLAVKSWNQALRFNPGNQSLRKFVERRKQNRSVASP